MKNRKNLNSLRNKYRKLKNLMEQLENILKKPFKKRTRILKSIIKI